MEKIEQKTTTVRTYSELVKEFQMAKVIVLELETSRFKHFTDYSSLMGQKIKLFMYEENIINLICSGDVGLGKVLQSSQAVWMDGQKSWWKTRDPRIQTEAEMIEYLSMEKPI